MKIHIDKLNSRCLYENYQLTKYVYPMLEDNLLKN